MLPRSIGYEVSTPAVGKLVCNDIDVLPILNSDGQSNEYDVSRRAYMRKLLPWI